MRRLPTPKDWQIKAEISSWVVRAVWYRQKNIEGVTQRLFFQTAEGNPILRRIESMVVSGLSEGTQEAAQGILRDITTKAIYDPDRAIADSVVEDFQLGGRRWCLV